MSEPPRPTDPDISVLPLGCVLIISQQKSGSEVALLLQPLSPHPCGDFVTSPCGDFVTSTLR